MQSENTTEDRWLNVRQYCEIRGIAEKSAYQGRPRRLGDA